MSKDKMPESPIKMYQPYEGGPFVEIVEAHGYKTLQAYAEKVTEERDRAVEELDRLIDTIDQFLRDPKCKAGKSVLKNAKEYYQSLKEKD